MKVKAIISYVTLSCVFVPPLYGTQNIKADENKPILYYADSQTYDRELGILILKGHVEFDHEGTVLEADYVTYNESSDIVTASGNVRIRQANGEINFAEYVELTGDMKEGIVLQLRTLLEDNSKIAALEGRKFEDREEMDQAVYTPCELCGDKPPTWQLNARRATKDEVNNDIHFTDAQFRILDVPLMYFPYATQPLERRSGFLIPQPRYSTDLGFIIDAPYYLVLSEDKDITLIPTYLSKQSLLLIGKYRHALENGALRLDGSYTKFKLSAKDKKNAKQFNYTIPEKRGHFFAKAEVNLTEKWRFIGEGGAVTDKTYFRKYGIAGWAGESALTSKGTLEGFLNQRDYMAASVKHFQGLRLEDIQKNIPAVLPMVEYSAYSAEDPLGGRFNFSGNLLNLSRVEGFNMQRGIGEVGWQRPWVAPLGQVFTLFGSTRGDLYQIEFTGMLRPPPKRGEARFFPQTGFKWNWPFANFCNNQSYIIQPIAQMILAPTKAIGSPARLIPNEDSSGFEYNSINLFSRDRLPGYDLLDTGSRFVYGGQLLSTAGFLGNAELFLGQTYSFSQPNVLNKFQGLRNGASDYVGHFDISPLSWVRLNCQFRLAERTFRPLVSEFEGSVGPEIANLTGTYVFINRDIRPDKKDLKQINFTFTSKFTKYWTFTATAIQNLRKKRDGGGPLSRGIGFTYQDDCFTLGLFVQRQFFVARDVKPATVFLMTIGLRNVGAYPLISYDFDKGFFGGKYSKQNQNALMP